MTVRYRDLALAHGPVDPAQCAVLVILCLFNERKKQAVHVSRSALASQSRVSPKVLGEVLEQLIARGWIRRLSPKGPHEVYSVNLKRLKRAASVVEPGALACTKTGAS